MWKRRAGQIALLVFSLLVAGAAVLAWLWQDRPDIADIGWPSPTISSADTASRVTLTWLGVTTLLFDDGETQILIDGFFSRPSLADVILDRPVDSDAAVINFALDEYRMRRLAALIPVHSHFDHAMDVGEIANRTSASVLGSESTAAIARGAGVPEDQIETVVPDQPYSFGRFTVTLRPSAHAPLSWRGTVPFPGSIDAPLTTPAPISAWREGGSYTIVVSHPEGTAIVQGSAGKTREPLHDTAVDVVMLGVGGLSRLGRDYAEQYWQALVTSTGAKHVYPIHFDDFTLPFGEIASSPRLVTDIEKTAAWLEAFRDRWDVDTALFMPEFGRPIVLYPAPPPEPET